MFLISNSLFGSTTFVCCFAMLIPTWLRRFVLQHSNLFIARRCLCQKVNWSIFNFQIRTSELRIFLGWWFLWSLVEFIEIVGMKRDSIIAVRRVGLRFEPLFWIEHVSLKINQFLFFRQLKKSTQLHKSPQIHNILRIVIIPFHYSLLLPL